MGETEWPWLGTRKFWLITACAFVLAIVGVWMMNRRLSRPDAVVPVVAISGPQQATKGQTLNYAVLVRDRFGAPLPRALVRVGFWNTSLIELGRATTGDGGDATVEVKFPDDFAEPRSLVAIAEAGVADGQDAMTVSPKTPGAGSIFISTDKPLYQPGQTIHLRALAMAGDQPLADRRTVIDIRTADGVKVFHADKQTSAFGVVSADFALADQVKLGTYTIAVTTTVTPAVTGGGDAGAHVNAVTVQAQRQVEVKRYSLPKLKLAFEDVSALTPNGLTGKARATWIFGEPVTKSALAVSLEIPGGRTIRVAGQTDKDGVYAFQISASLGKAEQQLRGTFTLRARVEVEGGIHAEATRSVATLHGELKLEAFAESGALVPNVEQTVFVVVTQSQNKAGVTVRALPDGEPAKTSEQGIASVKVRPREKPSAVTIVAFADDGSEGKTDLSVALESLVVRPDRATYTAGETARVTVLGAEVGDRVSLRMTKGSEPIAMGSCVVVSAETGCESALTIPAKTSGLAWLHALSLPSGKRPVKAGKRLVIAGGGSRDLDLKMTADKRIWAPRDLGAIDVAVTGTGGVPVMAQLGVAVADEAVFALADVRPDLEKIFFTVGKDVAGARRPYYGYSRSGSSSYGYSSQEHALPAPFEAAAAYDASTAADVKSTILAALTTMPDLGGVDNASTSSVAQRAIDAVEGQKKKLAAWCIVALAAFTLAAFIGFALYGVSRFRRPLLLATPTTASDDATTLRLETRGYFADFLTGVLAPPVLAVAGVLAIEAFTNKSYNADRAIVGAWFVLAGFCAVLLVRAAMRVRRVSAVRDATTLRRVLFLLPLAIFFAHLTILLVIVDEGSRMRLIFKYKLDGLFLPIVIVAAAQITCGFLSVIRQTQLRLVTMKGRVWLLASRATFLGLPVTLVLCGMLVWLHHRENKRFDWADDAESREAEQVAPSSDNKEGGTGTRAKGEEGSMGNPNAPAAGAMFGAPKADAEVARPVVHVRDFFPETLLWAPDVVTDESGHARVQVPFADSITTWRFGLSAVSRTGQLGSATVPLVVKQDFFVDAALPPILTQGDQIAVPVNVFSYADGAQDVSLELEGDGVSAIGPAKVAVHLTKGEARGVRFMVRADKAGDRTVRLKATSAAHADAMERKVLVVPNGQAFTRAINGRVNKSASTTVELPEKAIDGGSDLYVKIYGGPLSQLSEGLDGVFRMPHGCFEQTSSTTYPSVLALKFLERTKSVSPDLEKKARDYIGQGYQRLISFEVSGGGFSMFGKDPAATVLTAYGLLEFADMAGVFDVDGQLVDRTREWLYKKRTPTGGWTKATYDAKDAGDAKDDALVTAYVAWAIAASLSSPEKDTRLASVLDVVAKSAPEDDAYALALRATALFAGARTNDARPLLERLAKLAIRGDDGVHFTSKAVGVMYSYGASMDVEVTGLAAHALALGAMEPELRSGALDWLVARRGAYGAWSTTQATIAAMRALLDEARPVTKAPQDIQVIVDGQPSDAFTMEPKSRDVHRLVSLRKFATLGKHVVEIRATGDGDVSYQLVAMHYLPWQRPTGAGLALEVAYAPNAVDSGSTMACHVRLGWRGKDPGRMPMIEIGVPPAFEVESDDLEALLRRAAMPAQRYTVERGKVTLYFVSLPEDKPVSFDLRMRARWPARVVAPSSSAYLYYEPEIRAETAPVQVRSL